MAIIDVVKVEMSDNELCKKFPSDNLRLGTQVVVYPTQIAFFVKGGQIYDEFEAGTYTLKTENIPLLNKLINLPFGSQSPFKAEVWYINLTTKMDMKWGTTTPIQLEDPKYNIIVPVRAYGQYGLKVSEPNLFLKTLIGNMSSFSAEKVNEYFKGQILVNLNNTISSKITKDSISILDVNAHLLAMSQYCQEEINKSFKRYGLQLTEFSFVSINVPTNDPSVVRLKEAKDLAARLKITGRDIYQMERSFDVLERAAGNEGAGGAMVGIGAGLGAGVGVGATMGNIAGQTINTGVGVPPPIPQVVTYYIYINGKQLGNQRVQDIQSFISQGLVSRDTLIWKNGLPNWVKIGDLPELAILFSSQTPPPIPTQQQ